MKKTFLSVITNLCTPYMYKSRCLFFTLLFVCSFCSAQDDWKLRVDKDGIRVFTRKVADSKLNTIKVESSFAATLSKFVAVILDVNSGDQWLYSTRSSSLIKQVSPSELFYYSEIGFPWPVANRDFVAHLSASQDPVTKTVTIKATNIEGMVPEKKGIVRMTHSTGRWTIVAKAKNLLSVEYLLEADPAGSLPAWLINSLDTKGPFETFKKLKEQVEKPVYTSAHLPFIVD